MKIRHTSDLRGVTSSSANRLQQGFKKQKKQKQNKTKQNSMIKPVTSAPSIQWCAPSIQKSQLIILSWCDHKDAIMILKKGATKRLPATFKRLGFKVLASHKKSENLPRPWYMKVEVNTPKLGNIFSPQKLSPESETWSTGQEQCEVLLQAESTTPAVYCSLIQFCTVLFQIMTCKWVQLSQIAFPCNKSPKTQEW